MASELAREKSATLFASTSISVVPIAWVQFDVRTTRRNHYSPATVA